VIKPLFDQLGALMVSVSPLATLIVPVLALVKLPSVMIKLPPLRLH
jgi:hypothetical protein